MRLWSVALRTCRMACSLLGSECSAHTRGQVMAIDARSDAAYKCSADASACRAGLSYRWPNSAGPVPACLDRLLPPLQRCLRLRRLRAMTHSRRRRMLMMPQTIASTVSAASLWTVARLTPIISAVLCAQKGSAGRRCCAHRSRMHALIMCVQQAPGTSHTAM